MYDSLRDPWWKRIIAGDPTAIPAEWLDESGSIKLAGEHAAEFIEILELNEIEMSSDLANACVEYAVRCAIQETGTHPNAMTSDEWTETYG